MHATGTEQHKTQTTNDPPPQTTHPGTGCIFHYDDKKPEGSGLGFTEADEPNFTGSYYSYTKAATESFLRQFPNVLTLRVRMPIVADLTYPRNFITKVGWVGLGRVGLGYSRSGW